MALFQPHIIIIIIIIHLSLQRGNMHVFCHLFSLGRSLILALAVVVPVKKCNKNEKKIKIKTHQQKRLHSQVKNSPTHQT